MIYVIDAWLERREPQLRICHQDTGQVVISLKGPDVERVMEDADLNWGDLMYFDKTHDQEIAKTILASQNNENDAPLPNALSITREDMAAWVYTI